MIAFRNYTTGKTCTRLLPPEPEPTDFTQVYPLIGVLSAKAQELVQAFLKRVEFVHKEDDTHTCDDAAYKHAQQCYIIAHFRSLSEEEQTLLLNSLRIIGFIQPGDGE